MSGRVKGLYPRTFTRYSFLCVLAVYLRQVGSQSLGQEETEPRGQHGTVSLGRNGEDLGFYHVAKLHLPAHTQPPCFLPPLLQQSVLGFFARKMAKRTPEILLKQARR